MHITDPVADMLTRVRNANNAKHETVDVPASNMKKSIAQILLDEGLSDASLLIFIPKTRRNKQDKPEASLDHKLFH